MKVKFILTVFVVLTLINVNCSVLNEKSNKTFKGHHREKRFYPPLVYSYNAASGILLAIALPLDIPQRNVFVSYNFEANYNMPGNPSDSFPGPIKRFPGLIDPHDEVDPTADVAFEDFDTGSRAINEETEIENPDDFTTPATNTELTIEPNTKIVKRDVSNSLITRENIYRLLEGRLNAYGMDGKKCLLLAICESSKTSFLEHNGILGNILHVVLTPTSSVDEHLPPEYEKAEKLGIKQNCKKYEKRCLTNILQLISTII